MSNSKYNAFCDRHCKRETYGADHIDDIEKKVDDLTEGTIPDGSVTYAKLAKEAKQNSEEINTGAVMREWHGTSEEYDAHIKANGGQPLPNVKYYVTGEPIHANTADGVVKGTDGKYTALEKNANGVINNGEIVIATKKLLWSGSAQASSTGSSSVTLNDSLKVGDEIVVEWELSLSSGTIYGKTRAYVGTLSGSISNPLNFEMIRAYQAATAAHVLTLEAWLESAKTLKFYRAADLDNLVTWYPVIKKVWRVRDC